MKSVFIYLLPLVIFCSCGSKTEEVLNSEVAKDLLITQAKQMIEENNFDQALLLLEEAFISKKYNAMDAVIDEQLSVLIESPIHRPILKSLILKHASSSKGRMVRDSEKGKRIKIQGTVYNIADSTLISGAKIEMVQTDYKGSYFYEEGRWNPRLFGVLVTDKNGQFEIETIQPGRYTDKGSELASHIHFNLTHPSFTLKSGEFTFSDDPIIKAKGNYNNAPIAVHHEEDEKYHLTLFLEEATF